jgi:uncharacterized protein (DUF58 family)
MVTRAGWATLAASVALLVLAALLGWVELATIAVAGLLAVGLAWLWVLHRPQLSVDHRVRRTRVTVGDDNDATVALTNGSRRSTFPMTAFDRIGSSTVLVSIPRLAAGGSTSLTYAIPTDRRAVLDVGPLEVRRADPFMLVRADQRHGRSVTVFIHPRRHPLRPMPATLERSLEGPTSDTARGSQVFHALREYVPGDPRRLIHWKTSARTGTLMVRQHVDTSLPDLTVVLDTRLAQHDVHSFEQAVEVAASLLVACAAQGFPARLRTPDGRVFEPPGGEDSSTWFLDRLAGVEQVDRGDLVGMAQAMQAGAGGYALVVVTGRPSSEDVRALTPLTRRFDSVTVVDLNPDPHAQATAHGVERMEATTSIEFAELWNGGTRR